MASGDHMGSGSHMGSNSHMGSGGGWGMMQKGPDGQLHCLPAPPAASDAKPSSPPAPK
jgi:hypothetical protein